MAIVRSVLVLCFVAGTAQATNLKVMFAGLGTGTVVSGTAINCPTDCSEIYSSTVPVIMTATAAAGSTFVRWLGDCTGTGTCTVSTDADRSVHAEFRLNTPPPAIGTISPTGIQAYLTANTNVTTSAQFMSALPAEYKQNWLLMVRSESLQTGTPTSPRVLVPSADARNVFSFALAQDISFPGAHPDGIEYMQWDAATKNFRFHEIVVNPIGAMNGFDARPRGVLIDDPRCPRCHSTRNFRNPSTFPGTTGVSPGTVQFKNKPNWDTYDSWTGLLGFNRDRLYPGSVEMAAMRRLLDPWNWSGDEKVRALMEQLDLQPAGVPTNHAITRVSGGTDDGLLSFGIDASTPTTVEPSPVGTATQAVNYSFDAVAGTGAGTTIQRGATQFLTMHHSAIPGSDEGRAVHFFDLLGGAAGSLNQTRVADEINNTHFATSSSQIDVRPVALAITKNCLRVSGTTVLEASGTPALAVDLSFFTSRNGGMTIDQVISDTLTREQSLPRRKADNEKHTMDRSADYYAFTPPANGLIQAFGGFTIGTATPTIDLLRQEVFRRPLVEGTTTFAGDSTVMGGIYVDREIYTQNTQLMGLYRYFLEPLGVSVDKWSMGVRGRSRTYTFADIFGSYINAFTTEIQASLTADPVTGLTSPFDCTGANGLIAAVNSTLATSALPPVGQVPFYTDVQRIFNKACVECHGGLGYPPFSNFFPSNYLDFSEDDNLTMGDRLTKPNSFAMNFSSPLGSAMSRLYRRITQTLNGESCPGGVMPCGGPPLSKVDIETIRRWLDGARPFTWGDPHLTTMDGVAYDFQGAGEYVLLKGEGFEVQARQAGVDTDAPLGPNAYTGLTSCVALNTAAAIRVGRHRVTYQPNLSGEPDPSGMQLRVDGQLIRLEGGSYEFPDGGRIVATAAAGGLQIEMLGGTEVVLTPGFWDHYKVWYLNIDVNRSRASLGLMGAIAARNWLPQMPDGSNLGPRPADLHQRYVDLYGKFGNAWRVTDKTSLFDYAPGTGPATYRLDAWPGDPVPQQCRVPRGETKIPPPPPLKVLPAEVAKKHCSGLADAARRAFCEMDVAVTGEATFAKTYEASEKVALNERPVPPKLIYPLDDQVELPRVIAFNWEKTKDPDGDPTKYRLCIWPEEATPTFKQCLVVAEDSGALGLGLPPLLLLLLLILLIALLVVLQLLRRATTGRFLLGLLALALFIAILFILMFGRVKTMSHTPGGLQRGRPYYWKVIAEDGHGGTTESEVRRFATARY